MRIDYSIHGSFFAPDGSAFLAGSANLIRLPEGQIISVHPVIEMASDENSDDHRNLTYAEARSLGVFLADYERSSVPW